VTSTSTGSLRSMLTNPNSTLLFQATSSVNISHILVFPFYLSSLILQIRWRFKCTYTIVSTMDCSSLFFQVCKFQYVLDVLVSDMWGHC
jgi:hypothetical protein